MEMKFKVEELPEKTKVKCDCKLPSQAILKVTFPHGDIVYLCRNSFKKEIEERMRGVIEGATFT